jgi:hypothetical protein
MHDYKAVQIDTKSFYKVLQINFLEHSRLGGKNVRARVSEYSK